MNALRKTWLRVIISLFAGGILIELIFISTGDVTRKRPAGDSGHTIIYGIVIFLILTAGVNLVDKKKLF
jgi:hypothetical protein